MIQLLKKQRLKKFLEKNERSPMITRSYLIKILLPSLAQCRKSKTLFADVARGQSKVVIYFSLHSHYRNCTSTPR